jgi:hypothetical protein
MATEGGSITVDHWEIALASQINWTTAVFDPSKSERNLGNDIAAPHSETLRTGSR